MQGADSTRLHLRPFLSACLVLQIPFGPMRPEFIVVVTRGHGSNKLVILVVVSPIVTPQLVVVTVVKTVGGSLVHVVLLPVA